MDGTYVNVLVADGREETSDGADNQSNVDLYVQVSNAANGNASSNGGVLNVHLKKRERKRHELETLIGRGDRAVVGATLTAVIFPLPARDEMPKVTTHEAAMAP